jgi:ABC-type transporter Mla subunit MlaD
MVKDARQRKRAWYGGAIIVLLAGLAFFIFFLDAIRAQFERRYAIVVVMPRAPPGLGDGSPVWISGKKVGTVTTIGFLPRGPDTLANVVVTLDLPRAARPQVRADSRVRLTSARIIGEPALDLVPGTRGARVLDAGDTLRIERRLSLGELSRDADAVRAQLDTTRLALQRLAPRLRVRGRQTRRALDALEASMAEARTLGRSINESPTLALLTDPAFAGSLAHSRRHAAELARLLAVWRARTDSRGELRSAVERLQLHADSLRAQLDATAALLQSGNGTLARAQRDSALIHAVDAARAALDSLLADAKRNPLRFIF